MFFEYQGWLISISHFNRGSRSASNPLTSTWAWLNPDQNLKKNQHSVQQPSYFQFIICKHFAKRTRDLVFTFYYNILGW